MKFLRAAGKWAIYSNVFIAVVAVLMAWQTAYLFHLQIPNALLPFIFAATLCSYSFHWYLSLEPADNPRQQWLNRFRWVHGLLWIISVLAVAFYGWQLKAAWPWLLTTALLTFLYSAPKIHAFRWLRKVAIAKTIYLSLVWTLVTCALPVALANTNETPDRFLIFGISRFFLIYSICILFDYRDRDYDRALGVRSLITIFSLPKIKWLFIGSLLVFLITSFCLYPYFNRPFVIALLVLPGVLTACTYPLAIRKFSDMIYYGWLDGLMALSAAVFWLFHLMKW